MMASACRLRLRTAFLLLAFCLLQSFYLLANADCCKGSKGGGGKDNSSGPRAGGAAEAMLNAYGRNTQKGLYKPMMKDIYQSVVRDALLKKLAFYVRRHASSSGDGFAYAIASAWSRALYIQLAQQYYPLSWIAIASRKHRELGGLGDVAQTIKEVSLHGQSPSQNFVDDVASIGAFFVTAMVSQDVEKCIHLPEEQIANCLSFHSDELRAALELTLVTAFETHVAVDASRLFALNFFMLSAGPVCPFSAYTSSEFLQAALQRRTTQTLAAIVTKKQTQTLLRCDAFKERLLKLCVSRGVTAEDLVTKVDAEALFDASSLQTLFQIASQGFEQRVGKNVHEFADAIQRQSKKAIRREARQVLDSAAALMEEVRQGTAGEFSFQGILNGFLEALKQEDRVNPFKQPMRAKDCCKDKSEKEKAKIVLESIWRGMKDMISENYMRRMAKKQEKEKAAEEAGQNEDE